MFKKLMEKLTSITFQCVALCVVILAATVTLTVYLFISGTAASGNNSVPANKEQNQNDYAEYPFNIGGPTQVEYSEGVATIPDPDINSEFAALVDVSENSIIASRKAKDKIYPASLTKIMTLIVVVENIKAEQNLADLITASESVCTEMSNAGSSGMLNMDAVGDKLSVDSMLYLLMLKSDGVAATELAIYTAGTTDAFVEMMNAKAQAMGLTGTHFTNCTGLHDKDHYSTCRDMATILAYAAKNPTCYRYMTTANIDVIAYYVNNEGINSTYALHPANDRLISLQKVTLPAASIVGCKTGYTGKDSGYCLGTIAKSTDGKLYVCVTAKAESYDASALDQTNILKDYIK